MPIPLILASTSPYRRQLLERLQLPFQALSPVCDETPKPGESPENMVRRLSHAKAASVMKNCPDALIIGSDQVAVLDGAIIGKPGTPQRAESQLANASGRRVAFMTGLSLLDGRSGRYEIDMVPFTVHFRTLSSAMIKRYVARESPLNCAGSFKSEGLGVALFERLEGDDPSALMGLPLIRLVAMLESFGITVV